MNRTTQWQRDMGYLEEPQLGPLRFTYDEGGWYKVCANDHGENGQLYGYAKHDGSKWEGAPDAGPMSYMEILCLQSWMQGRLKP